MQADDPHSAKEHGSRSKLAPLSFEPPLDRFSGQLPLAFVPEFSARTLKARTLVSAETDEPAPRISIHPLPRRRGCPSQPATPPSRGERALRIPSSALSDVPLVQHSSRMYSFLVTYHIFPQLQQYRFAPSSGTTHPESFNQYNQT